MQAILYQIKRDVTACKGLGCPQRMQRTRWQIVAKPYTGFRVLSQEGPNSLIHWDQDNMADIITLDIFKSIFYENFSISNKFSLKCVLYGVLDNMSALVQIMAWCQICDKPLFTDAHMSPDLNGLRSQASWLIWVINGVDNRKWGIFFDRGLGKRLLNGAPGGHCLDYYPGKLSSPCVLSLEHLLGSAMRRWIFYLRVPEDEIRKDKF